MFGWEFPPHNSGGLGTACLGLTKAMSKQDVKLTFILPRKFDILQHEKFNVRFADQIYKEITDVEIKFVNSIIEPYLTTDEYLTFLKKHKLVGVGYGRNLYEEVALYTLKTKELVENGDFDIIHAHDWMSFKAGIEAKRLLNKPLIVHVHSTEIDRTGGNSGNSYIYDIEKEGMEQADLVITVSQWTKDMVIKHYGISPDKIRVVHNGIDLEDYDPINTEQESQVSELKEAGYKIVLFVGRITIQKGPDYFIHAAKQVLEYYPKAIFVVTGSGDMEKHLISLAAELGIGDKVLFTGFLRGKELQKMYQMADLFIMPSVSEPFGLTALESVVGGTPVLVSKQTGVSEVLTHVLTADFWDTEEMAHKILAVLNYDSLKLTLLENGKEQTKHINWHKASEKCISIYKSVLDNYFGK